MYKSRRMLHAFDPKNRLNVILASLRSVPDTTWKPGDMGGVMSEIARSSPALFHGLTIPS